MAMGRPPKPTALKRRLGTARPDRVKPDTLVLPAAGEIPKPPAGLRRHGKAAWARFWSLGPEWLNPSTDLAILTRLCQAYDEREELRSLIRRFGHLVAKVLDEEDVGEDDGAEAGPLAGEPPIGVVAFPGTQPVVDELEGQPHGGALRRRRKGLERVYEIKANPAVVQLRKLEELITRYEGLCGFTPSDRSRLGLAQMKAASALDEFLSGGQ